MIFLGQKKRIARVPNVQALLNARDKIKTTKVNKPSLPLPRNSSSSKPDKIQTLAQTNAKGQKRVAHVPAKVCLSIFFIHVVIIGGL